MKLFIGNKNYSSWSLRPWIAMREKGIEFEEKLIPFEMASGNPRFSEFSPHGKVPVLVDYELTVWESLAILEYIADKFPQAGLWPSQVNDRAWARSIACEMHAGFGALRAAAPMNMRREPSSIAMDDALRADVERIEQIWDECLQRSPGGPFLFGEFGNVDAMFAPVVNRLEVYQLSSHAAVLAYTKAMKALPAWREWEKAALAETWVVEEDEV